MTFRRPFLSLSPPTSPHSLLFSLFSSKNRVPSPHPTRFLPASNHQRSAAAAVTVTVVAAAAALAPVGSGFGKRVPAMSLINSLRRRGQRKEEEWRENERDRSSGWLNNDKKGVKMEQKTRRRRRRR